MVVLAICAILPWSWQKAKLPSRKHFSHYLSKRTFIRTFYMHKTQHLLSEVNMCIFYSFSLFVAISLLCCTLLQHCSFLFCLCLLNMLSVSTVQMLVKFISFHSVRSFHAVVKWQLCGHGIKNMILFSGFMCCDNKRNFATRWSHPPRIGLSLDQRPNTKALGSTSIRYQSDIYV